MDQPGFKKLVETQPEETSTERRLRWKKLFENAHAANVLQFPPRNEPAPQCLDCKDQGYILRRRDDGTAYGEPCHCKETLAQYRTRVLREMSGLTDAEYEHKRFETFDLSHHRDCAAMLAAAKQWLTKSPVWLVFIGDNGIGKSHLAMAATAELIDTGNLVKYLPWYDLTATLRSAMRSNGTDAGYDLELSEVSDIPYLVVDEIYEEECRTPFQIAALTALIDRRYRKGYPTFIATNLTLDELSARSRRVADRFRDRSICHLFIAQDAVSVRPMLNPEGEA